MLSFSITGGRVVMTTTVEWGDSPFENSYPSRANITSTIADVAQLNAPSIPLLAEPKAL